MVIATQLFQSKGEGYLALVAAVKLVNEDGKTILTSVKSNLSRNEG